MFYNSVRNNDHAVSDPDRLAEYISQLVQGQKGSNHNFC
jgi:hypothetical protein